RAAAGPRAVTALTADRRDVARLAGTGSMARPALYITIARLGKAATIRRTATGRLIARVPAPAGTELRAVAAAGPGRAFLLAAQPAGPGDRPIRFYRLALGAAGRPGPLRPTRIPALTVGVSDRCQIQLAGPGGPSRRPHGRRLGAVQLRQRQGRGQPDRDRPAGHRPRPAR